MSLTSRSESPALLAPRIDHLVYATPDLEKTVDDLEALLGVRAAMGGRHPGRGTRNALLALSDTSYLEIVGPDPAQPATGAPRWFEIDALRAPHLVTWAAKATGLERLWAAAAQRGVHLGPIAAGSRRTADGTALHWQFTDPATVVGDGLVPFFIDWGESPHPAASAPRGPELLALRGEHPEPARIERVLAAVGIELPVEEGPRPLLIATLRSPEGTIELR